MFRRSVVAAILAATAFAAPADGATLTGTATTLTFTAAPGIENNLSVFGNPAPPMQLLISTDDDPVPYSAVNPLPAGCEDADANQNASPARAVDCLGKTVVTIDLGDLGDTGTTTGTVAGLTWLGNTGNDAISGAGGDQKILGGPGLDALAGGGGDDELDGGEGDDNLAGDAGDDRLAGGDGHDVLDGDGTDIPDGEGGDDLLEGGDGSDALLDRTSGGSDDLRGGAGGDSLDVHEDGDADVIDGGAGIDSLSYTGDGSFVNLTDGTAGRAGELESVTAIEDVTTAAVHPASVIGGTGPNSVDTGNLGDTVDPRAGNDFVFTGGGNDLVELRDGYADRVVCGNDVDTVSADTLDVVGDDCENVTRTDVGNANDTPDVPEDRAPTVTIGAPSPAAVLSTTAPNTITATATDDHGIAHVIFSTGERTLCTDTTAPYSCDYAPTSADVGRDTLVVVAVDTAGQTASAVRVVSVPRFKALGLSAVTTPKRDRRAPYTFTTRGKLALPTGVLAPAGCKGTVDVSFKAGKKTVSSRRVALKADCTYSSRVTFRLPRRLNPRRLSVVAVYGGNEVVEGIRANRQTVRPR